MRVGVGSLGAQAARTVLTALGIAIGIAALVSVVGISSSSRVDLLAQLDRFGTNLLEVRAGNSVFGDAATLPKEAPSMIRRIGPVDDVSAVAGLSATVRRTDLIPASGTVESLSMRQRLHWPCSSWWRLVRSYVLLSRIPARDRAARRHRRRRAGAAVRGAPHTSRSSDRGVAGRTTNPRAARTFNRNTDERRSTLMDGRIFRWVNRLAGRTGWAHGFFTAYAKFGIVLFAAVLLAAYVDGRQHGDLRAVSGSLWAAVAALIALGIGQLISGAIDRAPTVQRDERHSSAGRQDHRLLVS